MRVETIYCNKCGDKIPTVKKKDALGVEREFYRFGKLDFGYPFENIDPRDFGIDLCERCSGEINLEMQRTRMGLLSK